MIRAVLKERFGLTAQEAQLVLRLIRGASLGAAGKALNIEYETARSHLKSVFSKTATRRQSQLVVVVVRTMLATDPQALGEAIGVTVKEGGST